MTHLGNRNRFQFLTVVKSILFDGCKRIRQSNRLYIRSLGAILEGTVSKNRYFSSVNSIRNYDICICPFILIQPECSIIQDLIRIVIVHFGQFIMSGGISRISAVNQISFAVNDDYGVPVDRFPPPDSFAAYLAYTVSPSFSHI